MKNSKKIIPIGLMLIILVIVVQGSMAYFTSESNVINKFLASSTDIEVEEEFIPPEQWDGNILSKSVQIKNESNTPVLVRVSITPRWVNEDGSPFSGDTSSNTITLDFTKELKESIEEEKWFKGNDGYYYYLKILEGNNVTSILLESVALKEGVILPEDYKGKNLYVDVKAEAVQATNHDENQDGINEYQFEKVWFNVDANISGKLKEILDK